MSFRLCLLLFASCTIADPAARSSTPKPEADPPVVEKPESQPAQVRTAPKLPGAPSDANPPGVRRLSGPLQVDRDVQFIDEVVGTGAIPEKGKQVTVHYTGWLTDGTMFDSSVDRGQPIVLRHDVGQVIKGWDIGISTMRVGGKRRIIIPSDLGYGDRGAGGAIPPDSTLVFDLELLDVTD